MDHNNLLSPLDSLAIAMPDMRGDPMRAWLNMARANIPSQLNTMA